MKFTEILNKNRYIGSKLSGQKYEIGLLSNVTILQLKEVLEFVLRLEGVKAEITVGNYNTIVQDSYQMSQADALVIFWEAANLVDGLHYRIEMLEEDEADLIAERIEREIDLVLNNLINTPLVVVNRFSSILFSGDIVGTPPLTRMCKRLNAHLERKSLANLVLVDLEPIIAAVGLSAAVDYRQYLSAKALYSLGFLRAYAEAVKPIFLAVQGRRKKLLVLDCDNTLWGGIVGEDGVANIRLGGETLEGKVFQEVQSLLMGLQRAGVLLALCSKNNSQEVDSVLESHPEMVLRDKDFVSKKLDWNDKASNLMEIADDLNLGLDSIVFLDDSPFELGLIRDALPGVFCVQVPDQISDYPRVVRELKNTFFSPSKTIEDEHKTEMYRQEVRRKAVKRQHVSIDDYLAFLGLRLKFYSDDASLVARAVQLSQKTNQFNLTTRRYTASDIHRMLGDDTYMVESFFASDRYGDYGVTGLAVIKLDSDMAIIESFLMSCRVIGRNFEYSFFDQLVRQLKVRGVRRIKGEYIATQKNVQVAGFYEELGFYPVAPNGNLREIEVADYRFRNVSYIAIDS